MITLAAASRITEDKISKLREDFRTRVKAWLAACRDEGLLPYVYCGVRTVREQNQLFAQGPKITKARGGQSFHNYGRAVDWVPLVEATKAPGMYDAGWDREDLYQQGQAIAKRHGLVALDWESPHLQDALFRSWRELSSNEEPIR
jgi:peptidoglycan L-alanyl-D-glutamate endopeptidase CwlK